MNAVRALVLAALLVPGAACNGGDDVPTPPVDAFATTCGMPGDTGNELGVGQYCTTLNDCSNTPEAFLCSNIGDATTFFCTKTCQQPGDAGTNPCGTGAECVCGNGGCGCTPSVCLD